MCQRALVKKAVPLWIRCFISLSTHHALILSLSKDHPEPVEGSSWACRRIVL